MTQLEFTTESAERFKNLPSHKRKQLVPILDSISNGHLKIQHFSRIKIEDEIYYYIVRASIAVIIDFLDENSILVVDFLTSQDFAKLRRG